MEIQTRQAAAVALCESFIHHQSLRLKFIPCFSSSFARLLKIECLDTNLWHSLKFMFSASRFFSSSAALSLHPSSTSSWIPFCPSFFMENLLMWICMKNELSNDFRSRSRVADVTVFTRVWTGGHFLRNCASTENLGHVVSQYLQTLMGYLTFDRVKNCVESSFCFENSLTKWKTFLSRCSEWILKRRWFCCFLRFHFKLSLITWFLERLSEWSKVFS